MFDRLTVSGLALMLAITPILVTAPAQAKGSRLERSYRGKIVLLKKRPPMGNMSDGKWFSFLRQNKMTHIWPDKKVKGEKQWKFDFMAFFNRKLNDVEVNVKFYDITDAKKFIAADSFYLNRGQTVFISSMVLEKPEFQPNRHYVMYVTSAKTRRSLAMVKFWLRGQGEVYSGKVEFSEDEAKLR